MTSYMKTIQQQQNNLAMAKFPVEESEKITINEDDTNNGTYINEQGYNHSRTTNEIELQSEPSSKSKSDESSIISVDHTPIHAPPDQKVLGLLFPPGIHGGFRNQIIRLIGLVSHAVSQNIHYILLDSLIAVTVLPEKYVPFEYLFDVDHWNSFSEHLPLLVDYHESSNYTCWKRGGEGGVMNDTHGSSDDTAGGTNTTNMKSMNADVIIKRGFFSPIYNRSRALINGEEDFSMYKLRNLDLLEEASKCQGNPIPIGGGLKAGKLWKTYMSLARKQKRRQEQQQQQRKAETEAESDKQRKEQDTIQSYVLQALRPKQKWRNLSMSCVGDFADKYLGLHLRMEMDMIGHKCGRDMEHNTTRLFHHINAFLSTYHLNHTDTDTAPSIDAISIATSRKGMEDKDNMHYKRYKAFADENLNTLNHYTKSAKKVHILGGKQVSVFECGQDLVQQYLDENPGEAMNIDYGSVLPMMVNFHLLTEAKIFIGVRKSSYSTDVWTTRYYQGKGMYNYEYTPGGIFPIENRGLPPPHVDC